MMNSALCGMRAMFSWPRSAPGSGNAARRHDRRAARYVAGPSTTTTGSRVAKIGIDRSGGREDIVAQAVRAVVRADLTARQEIVRIVHVAHPRAPSQP
jgi:hypothetical protein